MGDIGPFSRVPCAGEPLAHISVDGRGHSLRNYLFKTAERAAAFAAAFGFREWGRLAALWHDLAISGRWRHVEESRWEG